MRLTVAGIFKPHGAMKAATAMRNDSALDPEAWPDDRLTIANLGHATLALNFFGVRCLTDPTLFDRIGLAVGSLFTLGPRRIAPSPLVPRALQSIALILITHAHTDHLDIASLGALPKSAIVIACRNGAKLIAPLGFTDIRELTWGQSTNVGGLRVCAAGARHWGMRWPPFGASYGFNSYILEKDGHRMLVACDSAYTDLFAALKGAPPEVAAFSVGAYDPWIWNHANPEQAWKMFRQTGARYLVPLHWGTFRLSREPREEPMRRLLAAAGKDAWCVVLREIGGLWTMPEPAEMPDEKITLAQAAMKDR
jgi:L-ascorbate metabolism protein UlaG (beta-lactamase superfamily)